MLDAELEKLFSQFRMLLGEVVGFGNVTAEIVEFEFGITAISDQFPIASAYA